MRLRIKAENGKIVEGFDQMKVAVKQLDGDYIVHFLSLQSPNTVEEWRKLYFALRDVLHESVETGYTKNELHDEIKAHIIPKMYEESNSLIDWFGFSAEGISTKSLTESGWKEYMRRFKEFAMDTFEIYL